MVIILTKNSNIRRIDELGRIVIPKDIRKKLHIADGETLEIYIEDDEIRLRKYSPLPDIKESIFSLLDLATRTTSNSYIVTTRDRVLLSTDKDFQDKLLGSDLRTLVQTCTFIDDQEIRYCIEDSILQAHANIVPLLLEGDRSGLLIEYNKDHSIKGNDAIKIIAHLIEKELE